MPNYDFHSLSSLDFEELVRDLLQAQSGKRFESFKSGRDQGIDLRYSNLETHTIVQCKHFVSSGFSKLLTHLREAEFPKVAKLNPSRYIVATSVGLTPANKDAILNALAPYIKSTTDIYGAHDLNNLLALFPEIERSNFKLWLTSIEVLQHVLYNAERCQSDFEVDRISRKLSLYVQSNAYPSALRILENTNVLVVSGPPGIGKTTLAEMLLYEHLEKGYEPVVIKSEIDEGKKLYKPIRNQIFYFDDFLGQTFLQDRQGFLLKNQDTILVEFIELIRRSKGARFILTTREHILRNALIASERFQDNSSFEQRCVLQLSDYTFGQKARILYNHLYFSDLPQPYKLNVLEDDFYLTAIRHENYNPRLIEWLSSYSRVKATLPAEYSSLFARILDNPEKVWQHAFDNQISEGARNILFVLLTLGGDARLDRLENAWGSLHRYKSKKYNYTMAPNEFRQSLKELEGGFVRFEGTSVHFLNPSVKDFLSALLDESPEHGADLLEAAILCDQITRIWQLAENSQSCALQKFLLARESILIESLERTISNVVWEQRSEGVVRYLYRSDSCLEARASLSASITGALKSEKSANILAATLRRVWTEWDHGDGEFQEAVDVLERLEDLISKSDGTIRDQATQLYASTKEKLIGAFHYASALDFESLASYADPSNQWTDQDNERMAVAFGKFINQGFDEERNNCSGSDELSSLRTNVASTAKRLNIDLQYELGTLDEDISELEYKEARDMPEHRKIRSRVEQSFLDDDEVRRMFDSLRND